MNLNSHSSGLCKRKYLFTSYSLMICLISISLTGVMVMGCKKDSAPPPPPIVPTVTTAVLTNITTSGATSGGTIVSDGGATVTKSGIVWSKANATPTLTDSVVAGTTSIGSFTTNITGLEFNKTYYIRAFATNSVGTGYGSVLTLNTTNDTNKVRFTYNGQEVTYGIIISPTTGKKWLDRNLGATRVATVLNDYQAYGDLFQWGRPADGHQLINWTASTTGTTVNGSTTTLATSDVPGHSNFISAPDDGSSNYDWRDNNNRNRWVTLPQGPCPAGWHVPAISEWAAEVSSSISTGGTATSGGIKKDTTAFGLLKLTNAGRRNGYVSGAGLLANAGNNGYYWASSDALTSGNYSRGQRFSCGSTIAQIGANDKAYGHSIRCIKD